MVGQRRTDDALHTSASCSEIAPRITEIHLFKGGTSPLLGGDFKEKNA
jgi:hypothetical protein